jgi:lipoprotein-anchoring transpeptidase ErfK/SrfK
MAQRRRASRALAVRRLAFPIATAAILATTVTAASSAALALPRDAEAARSASAPSTAAGARAVQQRLVALRYLPVAAVTGRWDYATSQALVAFQGWQGLARDAVAGPQTLAALRVASAPRPAAPTRGHSVEVFRSKGVTLLVDDGRVVRAIHSSSGRPGYTTPAGGFRVFRKELRSWSYPYRVWLPYASYFNGGIAIHAYADVPAYPVSHGCIRIPAPDAAVVYGFAHVGTPVAVF